MPRFTIIVLILVSAAAAQAPLDNRVSFIRDIEPMLTRHGCSAGGCHGAAQGKNGFRLSLFGYDPEADYWRVTREHKSRRVDLDDPVRSLLLQKPLGQVPHKGGIRLKTTDEGYDVLLRWLKAGAPKDTGDLHLKSLRAEPEEVNLPVGGKVQPRVFAEWSDGQRREVNSWVLWTSSADPVADVDESGTIRARSAGEAVVLARYGSTAAAIRVLVPRTDTTSLEMPDADQVIDRLLLERMRQLGLSLQNPAPDSVFIRRVTLDIAGRLPSVVETRSFLDDQRPDKRNHLVQRLLDGDEWIRVFAREWIEQMRIDSQPLNRKGVEAFTDEFVGALRRGERFDQLAYRLLTAEGGHFDQPVSAYYAVDTDAKSLAERTAQLFMGVRIQCAQCHNHPFDRWTMDDYYGFTAFFGRVAVKTGGDPRERVIYERGDGDIRHPRDGRVMPPTFLGGGVAPVETRAPRREVLARWLIAADNTWFAKNLANRLFARFFGRGLVDPVDDARLSNPPSHPELLDYLAKRVHETGFNLRDLMHELVSSKVYQADTALPGVSPAAFSGAAVRRLGAEELHDAIVAVSEVPTRFFGLGDGDSAFEVEDGDPSSYFLDLFGRPRRASSCSCERRDEPTLGQALHLINGTTVTDKIRAPGSRLKRHLAANSDDTTILEDLFLAAYSRRPRHAEMEMLTAEIKTAATKAAVSREQVLEDIFWSVLNSEEFCFSR